MYVPDRIMVRGEPQMSLISCKLSKKNFTNILPLIIAGNDRHFGAKALPRELQLESAVAASPDPILVKMNVS